MQVTAQDTADVVVMTLTGRLVLEDMAAELRGALDGLIRQGRLKARPEPAGRHLCR